MKKEELKEGKNVILIKDKGGNVIGRKVVTYNVSPSITDPSFRDQCDINKIIGRWIKTGVPPVAAQVQGVFQDVSTVGDLLESVEKIENAKTLFMTLPPEIRGKFDNNMVKFGNWMMDPTNDQEAIDLGLKVGVKTKPKEDNDPKVSKPEVKNEQDPKVSTAGSDS